MLKITRSSATRRNLAASAMTLICSALAFPAAAVEDVTPFLSGSTVGAALGVLPPEGVYGSVSFSRFDLKGYGSRENFTGAELESYPFSFSALWVPGVKIFGANFAVGVIQPLRSSTLTTPRITVQRFGQVNTLFNLGTLSWNLGDGFFVSTGLNLYAKDGDYKLGSALNVGRNYWTFEPKLAVSYIKDGWTITGNFFVNVSTKNEYNGYQSGAVAIAELTAMRRVYGKFDIGIGSSIVQQFTDDSRNGVVVPAVLNGRGRGARTDFVSVGPVAAYDFGPASLTVYYLQAIRERNVAAGGQFWARLNFALYKAQPVTAAALERGAR